MLPAPDGFLTVDAKGRQLFVVDLPYALPIPGVGLLEAGTGAESDGQSVPPLAWPVVGHPFDPRALPGALAHDLIGRGQLPAADGRRIGFAEWNRIYLSLNLTNGVQRPKAYAKYVTLMLCAGPVWRRMKRNTAQISAVRKVARIVAMP